jgi:hypothetical protein
MDKVHPALRVGGLNFSVLDDVFGCIDWWLADEENLGRYKEYLLKLNEPSGLGYVLLPKRHFLVPKVDIRYRIVDFSGTSVKQAIDKILKFYKHKTFRREIGDHTFFEGFIMEGGDKLPRAFLGS